MMRWFGLILVFGFGFGASADQGRCASTSAAARLAGRVYRLNSAVEKKLKDDGVSYTRLSDETRHVFLVIHPSRDTELNRVALSVARQYRSWVAYSAYWLEHRGAAAMVFPQPPGMKGVATLILNSLHITAGNPEALYSHPTIVHESTHLQTLLDGEDNRRNDFSGFYVGSGEIPGASEGYMDNLSFDEGLAIVREILVMLLHYQNEVLVPEEVEYFQAQYEILKQVLFQTDLVLKPSFSDAPATFQISKQGQVEAKIPRAAFNGDVYIPLVRSKGVDDRDNDILLGVQLAQTRAKLKRLQNGLSPAFAVMEQIQTPEQLAAQLEFLIRMFTKNAI